MSGFSLGLEFQPWPPSVRLEFYRSREVVEDDDLDDDLADLFGDPEDD